MSRMSGPHHLQRAEELLMAPGLETPVLLKALVHAVCALTSATAANIRRNGANDISEEWTRE